jgi:hypothetical protein
MHYHLPWMTRFRSQSYGAENPPFTSQRLALDNRSVFCVLSLAGRYNLTR